MFKRATRQFIVALFVFSLLGSAFSVSAAHASSNVQTSNGFIIKLITDNPNALQELLGTTVDKKFDGLKSPQFANVYGFNSQLTLGELRQRLAGQYVYLETDMPVRAGAVEITALPDDPGFTLNESNIDRQWGLVKAGFVDAWKTTKGSKDTVVAIIDTGLDATHEDFDSSSILDGYDIVAGKPLGHRQNSDDNGHGTLIAGVIGAATDNAQGISGANWDVSLLPVKALNASGSGSASAISEAIVWAADHGADIINMSLGGIGFAHDTTLANAISYAYSKNVVIISAAGNDVAVTGGNLDVDPVFPICDDNGQNMIIGVTATDSKDLKPDFANYGKACVDVSAPGKRILSTINHDPATGALSPDSYAYASGTSLSVPYVSAEAALLKSLFPFATNKQIRDRIIATADNIDNLNLSQCGGKSCAGLLGRGRINAAKSLEQQFIRFKDGDVVQIEGTQNLYLINGGKRQFISPFVRNQRYAAVVPIVATLNDLESYPEGSYAEPLDGTLLKIPTDSTVFYMSKGLRLPVTYQVFLMRGFDFNNVHVLANTEVDSWILGSFLPPVEGTLVRTGGNPTVYWTVGGVLHPINYKFWLDRGLSIFPVVYISDSDLAGYPKGDAYVL